MSRNHLNTRFIESSHKHFRRCRQYTKRDLPRGEAKN